jgi:phosphohistidine phosphatase SixA
MRHATAENNAQVSSDFDRILTEHGKKEAAQAGEYLRQYDINKAIVSYAKRTLQTFELAAKEFKNIHSEIVTELYQNSIPDVIYNLLSTQKNSDKHILVIGHNPLIYEIAFILANPKYHEFLISTMMPPARIITLEFSGVDDWQNIAPGQGEILDIFTAKNL